MSGLEMDLRNLMVVLSRLWRKRNRGEVNSVEIKDSVCMSNWLRSPVKVISWWLELGIERLVLKYALRRKGMRLGRYLHPGECRWILPLIVRGIPQNNRICDTLSMIKTDYTLKLNQSLDHPISTSWTLDITNHLYQNDQRQHHVYILSQPHIYPSTCSHLNNVSMNNSIPWQLSRTTIKIHWSIHNSTYATIQPQDLLLPQIWHLTGDQCLELGLCVFSGMQRSNTHSLYFGLCQVPSMAYKGLSVRSTDL